DDRLLRLPPRRGLRAGDDHLSCPRDGPSVTVVLAHEPLHRLPARAKAELGRDPLLLVEAQPIPAAAPRNVEQVANPEGLRARRVDFRPFARHQNSGANELREIPYTPPGPRRPVGDVQIPEATLAVLHVRLEQEHGVPEPLMTLLGAHL